MSESAIKYSRKSHRYMYNIFQKNVIRFNIVCENGTYGNNCVNNCIGNCLDDSPCNRQTGHCEGGCKPGYTDALCKQRM